MKCELCKQEIERTFLGKLIGTYLKDAKGKKHTVCSRCQKLRQGKDDILAALKA
ncbi:hypothetical protein J4439_01195 [Candidatus Woesearchaeota archaeon]|nr:hypothetical protein [Candidatus Woesearchaeota archaeon]